LTGCCLHGAGAWINICEWYYQAEGKQPALKLRISSAITGVCAEESQWDAINEKDGKIDIDDVLLGQRKKRRRLAPAMLKKLRRGMVSVPVLSL
jgi:hypothetical protein